MYLDRTLSDIADLASPFGKIEKIRKDFVDPEVGEKFWEWTMAQVRSYL
jgi:hypothetical protein